MVKARKNCGVLYRIYTIIHNIIHPNILYGLSDGSYFKQTMMRAIMSESLWPNIIFAMAYRNNTKPIVWHTLL